MQDENNWLKGEQGKPNIKANKPKPPRTDHSPEKERRKSKPREKRSKQATIQIHREQTLEIVCNSLYTRYATTPRKDRWLNFPTSY